jgi:hypothetical protein
MESNAILSWRGTVRGAGLGGTNFVELLIVLLLDDSEIVPGASSETAFNE